MIEHPVISERMLEDVLPVLLIHLHDGDVFSVTGPSSLEHLQVLLQSRDVLGLR